MGDPDAQYELGCRLRVEVRLYSVDDAFFYLQFCKKNFEKFVLTSNNIDNHL